jgi:LemA protein
MITGIIIVALVVVIILYCIGLYNRLVRMRNNRENAFGNIDVQLKQRHDLVPQLVECVKGYAAHEKETFQRVTELRNQAVNAQGMENKIAAENALSTALSGLKVTLEAYPELKANQNFLQLQGEISDIENKLAATRRFFNSATKEYNNAAETFPANIVAGMFHFQRGGMFEIPQEDRATYDKAPDIKF